MEDYILQDREMRMKYVKDFFDAYPQDSLVMIKANIPGLNKNIPIANFLVKVFLNHLKSMYSFFKIDFHKSYDGPYFLCGLKRKNETVKKRLISIEDTHPLGRLIDLDYFVENSESISRKKFYLDSRQCMLCEESAILCIRRQTHKIEEVLMFIEKTVVNYFSKAIVDLVDFSIIRELSIDNKFGLVSFTSRGSHADMNYLTMLRAKDSILDYFRRLFVHGFRAQDLSTLLFRVRHLGIQAEERMLKATKGINAYKGVIFLLGFITLSFGYTLKTSANFESLFTNIKIIAEDIYTDFDVGSTTFGVKMYHEHGITGIRGIVKNGFETVRDKIDSVNINSSDDDLRNLLYEYMLTTEDTVFMKRAGSYEEYLKYRDILASLNPNDPVHLKQINKLAVDNNLSFGGSADLLIATIFLVSLRDFFIET